MAVLQLLSYNCSVDDAAAVAVRILTAVAVMVVLLMLSGLLLLVLFLPVVMQVCRFCLTQPFSKQQVR